jgi:hypothetical protein
MANELDEMNPSGNSAPNPAPESRKKSFFGGFGSNTPKPQNAQVEVKPNPELEAQARKTFF